jgi:hypothetical protein
VKNVSIEELKASTAIIMGRDIAGLYDKAEEICRYAFDDAIRAADVRLLCMPSVMYPYNRALAFYSPADNDRAPTISFFRHHIKSGNDGLTFHNGKAVQRAYDTLLHEFCHHYQTMVIGDNDMDRPHHKLSWYRTCYFVCGNLWPELDFTLEHFKPRGRGKARRLTQTEITHFPYSMGVYVLKHKQSGKTGDALIAAVQERGEQK